MQNQTLLHIKEEDFEKVVLKSSTLALVDFYADWCGPCRVLGPLIEVLSREYDGKVKFVKVNTDESQRLAIKYNIMSIPTVVLFKNGHVVDRLVGVQPAQVLKQRINRVLASN
jgi:thioredoxin 1